MNQKEKLIEIINNVIRCDKCGIVPEWIAEDLIFYGVTVQEWISVKDELPKYTDEYNVMVGVASEFGYFEKVTTLRFERIKGKEPRWVIPKNEIYNVISWMPMPQPPKGE